MSAFEVVLIIVGALAILVACTSYFRTRNVVRQLGESPRAFAHPEDRPIDQRPSEDERDEPLPKRPVRGRA
jgi:hypothetical protein